MKEDSCLHAALICLGMLYYSHATSTEKLNHSRPSLHGHHEKGKEGQVLHRSKRGWVWNQFFVIEEYTGPDPVLVGRVRNIYISVCAISCIMYKMLCSSRTSLPHQLPNQNLLINPILII